MDKSPFNLFLIILIFGSLVVLSFQKLANPLKVNRKANFWFGIFLLLWSTFWLDEVCFVANIQMPVNITIAIKFLQFFTPIAFFMSVLFFTNPSYRFSVTDGKYLILPAGFLMVLLLQESGSFSHDPSQIIMVSLILIQALFFTIASFFKIRSHQKKILHFSSDTTDIDLSWLEYIISMILSITLIFSMYSLFFNAVFLNVFINLLFLVVIYMISCYSLRQKEIFPFEEKQRKAIILIEQDAQNDSRKKIMPDAEFELIKGSLEELMQSQKPYLNSELNLIKLADLLAVTPHKLSYVINAGYHENFFQFINKFRVEKAKQLLVCKKMDKLSMVGIAYESGFNSKTAFNTTFKKITGLTPSEFKNSSPDL